MGWWKRFWCGTDQSHAWRHISETKHHACNFSATSGSCHCDVFCVRCGATKLEATTTENLRLEALHRAQQIAERALKERELEEMRHRLSMKAIDDAHAGMSQRLAEEGVSKEGQGELSLLSGKEDAS